MSRVERKTSLLLAGEKEGNQDALRRAGANALVQNEGKMGPSIAS